MLLQVQDNSGNVDIMSAYAVATPVQPGPDTQPPSVQITTPAGGHVAGNVTITASRGLPTDPRQTVQAAPREQSDSPAAVRGYVMV
jgi:hypothetical protein